jgi:hypothetical protein
MSEQGTSDTEVDHALEAKILELLAQRDPDRTICPSEAARAVAGAAGESDGSWRDLMDPARRAAGRLVEAGEIVVTQRGEVVDPLAAKGPIRLGRKR